MWLINVFKQKLNIGKQKLKIIIISSCNNLNMIDIAIIGIGTYFLACKLKKNQVFIVFIKD